jgi:lysozyme
MPKTRIWSILLRVFIVICILILVLVLFPKKTSEYQFEYSKVANIELPQNYHIHGIDISHHNGELAWNQIKEVNLFDEVPVKFVFIKATEGRTLKDSYFLKNWNASKKNGFIRGAYHFYIASRDPIEQAKNFCNSVELEEGDLPPVCDFEGQFGISNKKIKKDLIKFLQYVENYYNITPILYTNPKLYDKFFRDEEPFNDYKLWIASYNNKKIKNNPNLIIWQHNKSGKIPGSSKSVDYNVFLGSENDFNSILIK